MKVLKATGWTLFVFFAISIGLYPGVYHLSDVIAENGLLSQKPELITSDTLWFAQFNIHIILGGIALLTGWSQFLKKFRRNNLGLHRKLGMVYILSVLLSAQAGFYMALYAEGGLVAKLGFAGLGSAWLYTTIQAFLAAKKKRISLHQRWMIRSYALTFAAVTLRIWLPLFQYGMGMDFLSAYMIIAWLCWVPNLAWAEWKVRHLAG